MRIIVIILICLLTSCRSKTILTKTSTTTIDTTIVIPGDKISILSPIEALLEPQVIENSLQILTVQYNPTTRTIKVDSEVKEREVVVESVMVASYEEKKWEDNHHTLLPPIPKLKTGVFLKWLLIFISITLILAGINNLIRHIKGSPK